MTTGMSAPPIGSTISTPMQQRERDHRVERRTCCAGSTISVARTARTRPTNSATLTTFWPVIGHRLRRRCSSCSLPNAMKLPVTVSEPSSTSKPSAAICAVPIAPRRRATRCSTPATPTSVAASAPKHERDRDSLRHRRHRHPHAERIADDRAEHEPAGDPVVVDDLVVARSVPHDGEQHADRGQLHAAPRLVRACVRLRRPRMKRTDAAR